MGIEAENGAIFEEVPFEGILGLAFPSMSAKNITPIFDSVIQQKLLKKNEFAFYFNQHDPERNAMFWGGVDSAFYEPPIRMVPVSQAHYWALYLHDILLGTESLHYA